MPPFTKLDLIPVVSRMNGAGRSDLGVIGAVVLTFNRVTESGLLMATKHSAQFSVLGKEDGVLLSGGRP